MQALPVIAALGTVTSVMGTLSAGKDAEKLARQNAQNTQMEAERDARLEGKANAAELSQGRARLAASGVKMSGSGMSYLDELEATGRERENWIRKSGKSRADIERQEGKTARKQSKYQAMGQAFSGATDTFKTGRIAKMW